MNSTRNLSQFLVLDPSSSEPLLKRQFPVIADLSIAVAIGSYTLSLQLMTRLFVVLVVDCGGLKRTFSLLTVLLLHVIEEERYSAFI